MKVGTDGVLLGAWTPIHNSQCTMHNAQFRILDVGTGSGLIALMLAQRCPEAEIEAIDIDEAAVEQARENVKRAQTAAQTDRFADRIQTYHARLQEWKGGPYDLIVSNPPYFQNSLKNPDKGRQTARHTDSLSYEELIRHCARLLAKGGQLALILPAEAETEVRGLAAAEKLTLTRITRVYSKESKPAKRTLMAFVRTQTATLTDRFADRAQTDLQEDTLVLEDEKGGRSAAYSELCKDFYL